MPSPLAPVSPILFLCIGLGKPPPAQPSSAREMPKALAWALHAAPGQLQASRALCHRHHRPRWGVNATM